MRNYSKMERRSHSTDLLSRKKILQTNKSMNLPRYVGPPKRHVLLAIHDSLMVYALSEIDFKR